MSNNLSHIIRSFNRFELKYLIPLKTAEAFRKALGAYLVPDQHGGNAGSYTLTSLYYDSPAFKFYWEKVEGIKFRRKLRIRVYGELASLAPETPVFVEIKQRLDRVTQKRRILLPYQAALDLCDHRLRPQCLPIEQPVVDEILAMVDQNSLRPASIISYQRQAMIGTDYDIGLRVTFDTDLRYSGQTLQLHQYQPEGHMFPPDWCVMEIKVNERIPYWLTELVARYNLRLTRVSKYARSIELIQAMPVASWYPQAVIQPSEPFSQ